MTSSPEEKLLPSAADGHPTRSQQPPPYSSTYSNPAGPTASPDDQGQYSNPAGPGTPPPDGQGHYNTQYGGQYGSTAVVNQPQVGHGVQTRAMAQDYQKFMTWSILACIFCCLPLGLCAICEARAAKHAALSGNHMEAARHAQKAKRMISWSMIICAILTIALAVTYAILKINASNKCEAYPGYYC